MKTAECLFCHKQRPIGSKSCPNCGTGGGITEKQPRRILYNFKPQIMRVPVRAAMSDHDYQGDF